MSFGVGDQRVFGRLVGKWLHDRFIDSSIRISIVPRYLVDIVSVDGCEVAELLHEGYGIWLVGHPSYKHISLIDPSSLEQLAQHILTHVRHHKWHRPF